MIQRISVEPAMLDFLDGNTNDKKNPNENFARELLELFTIQKGEQVAQGDYTNYTEQDVVALARVSPAGETTSSNMLTTIRP